MPRDMAFEYLPPIEEKVLQSVRQTLTEKVTRMEQHRSFLPNLQRELINLSRYTTKITLAQFKEVFALHDASFKVFFGTLSAERLFAFFDQDVDTYLGFAEQVQLFTVAIAMYYHLLEEVNFYGLYDLIPIVRKAIQVSVPVAAELERVLRAEFYNDRNEAFKRSKENRLGQVDASESLKLAEYAHKEERNWKTVEQFQTQTIQNDLMMLQKRYEHAGVSKKALARNYLLQEKLLGLSGCHEEAKNTVRNCQAMMQREQRLMATKLQQIQQNIAREYAKKMTTKLSLVENRAVRDKEQIRACTEKVKANMERNLNVMENKMRDRQDKETSESAFQFSRLCKINLARSETDMRHDFASRINQTHKSAFQPLKNHSFVFRMVFDKGILSLFWCSSERKWLESLETIRHGDFNVRVTLHNHEKRPNDIYDEEQRALFRRATELCRLYDNDLNPIG